MSDDVATPQTLPDFSPPGNLPDFNPTTAKFWSDKCISYWMTGEITADPNVVTAGRTPLQQYFNGTVTAFEQSQQPATITWNAFPLLVQSTYKTIPLRWQVADSQRMFQDEYLEWSVQRDPTTKQILSVTYSCEGPEYWSVYASFQPDDFFKTVKALNPDFADQMNLSDFFIVDPKSGAAVYNPNNYWNVWTKTGSIIHLCQPNNTLSAEIDIAAQATVLREDANGNPITNPNQLILCSQYGNPGRHSDPTIGGGVNGEAQNGSVVSVANPVALYINNLDESHFFLDISGNTADSPPPKSADLVPLPEGTFTWVRGDYANKQQGLRLKLQLPAGTVGRNGKPLNVSNIWDSSSGGHHIQYGAQIADHVLMGVSAVTITGTPAPMVPCFGVQKKQAKEKAAAVAEVKANGEASAYVHALNAPAKEGWKLYATRRHDKAIV